MASMSIEFDITGVDVEVALRALLWTTSPPGLAQFLHTRAKEWLQKRAKDRFEIEGDDASGQWEDLKESTIAIRDAEGFVPIRINRRTSAMHNWVTRADGFVSVTGSFSQLEWPGPAGSPGLEAKYITAQKGRNDPRTPARPVVAANEADLLAVLSLLANFIQMAENMSAMVGRGGGSAS